MVNLPRCLQRHQLVDIDIVPHGLGITLLGSSHATPTTAVLDDMIARFELVEPMDLSLNSLSVAQDVARVGWGRFAPERAVTKCRLALTGAGVHPRLAPQVDHLPVESRSAAPLAGAGGIHAKLPADDLPGILNLHILGVRPGDFPERAYRSSALVAIVTRHSAGTALGMIPRHDVEPPSAGIGPVDVLSIAASPASRCPAR